MPKQTFNKAPYFDDFDASKNYTNILFKPSKAVQVRELNQLQSIQNNQRKEFGDHIFKQGSKVRGFVPKNTAVTYITFDPISPFDSLDIVAEKFNEDKLVGVTSGVEARYFFHAEKTDVEPAVVYVEYTKGGTNKISQFFSLGEVVNVIDSNGVTVYSGKVRCPTCPNSNDLYPTIDPLGTGAIWQIPESVFYIYGDFITSPATKIVAEKFSTDQESYKVGFDIVETIATTDDDNTLFDNALGYPNYSADGADRAVTRLVPTVRTLDATDGEDFILLAKVEQGTLQFVLTKTAYSEIMNTLAERTYDESGNYTVEPFKVSVSEHLKTSADDPKGRYLESEGGDEAKFIATISSGKAYVKGFQVERISETFVEMDKTRDVFYERNFTGRNFQLAFCYGVLETNSAFCSSDASLTSVFTNDSVEIYDNVFSGGLPTGTLIGTLKIYDAVYDDKDATHTKIKFFVTDVRMETGHKFSEAKTLYSSNTVPFLITLSTPVTLYNSAKRALISPIGVSNLYSLKDIDDPEQRSYGFMKRKKLLATLDGSGSYTFTSETGEEFDSGSANRTLITVSSTPNAASTPIWGGGVITATASSLTLNCGVQHAGKSVSVVTNVFVNIGQEKTKTLKKKILTAQSLNVDNILKINYSDIYSLEKIETYLDASPTVKTNVTGNFRTFNGQKDFGYINATFTPTSASEGAAWKAASNKFNITFWYFEHGAGDFFSVDSYSDSINDPTVTFAYKDIPSYQDSSGTTFYLRDCVDFRPLIIGDAEITSIQPVISGVFSSDIGYYLPRKDFIVINKDGEVYQKKGQSALTPFPPRLSELGDEMAIYELELEPYVYNVNSDIRLNFIENKRYTMRDIGKIEERIDRLEYYTTLSMLELEAKNLSVKDGNGLDKFKNGFFVDNFKDWQASDLRSKEFRGTFDVRLESFTPLYELWNTQFDYDSTQSTTFKQFDNILMNDYDEVLDQSQPKASKAVSVCPFYVFNRVGGLLLGPNVDSWTDIKWDTPRVINTRGTPENRINTETVNIEDRGDDWVFNNFGRTWGPDGALAYSTTDTTTEVETRNIGTRRERYNLGANLTDVSLNPYMRARKVFFFGSRMKPNTKLFAFFDKTPVSEYCYPLKKDAKPGDQLETNSSGDVYGVFDLPEKKFFAGEKTFRLTNDEKDSRETDVVTTSAETLYYSAGMSATKQRTVLNVITPIQRTTIRTVNTNTWALPPEPFGAVIPDGDLLNIQDEPVAQTFTVTKDCFVTTVGIFFKEKSSTTNCFLQIKDTLNGYPGPNVLGELKFNAGTVNISDNASVETKLTLPLPVFLQGGKDYAIIVGGSNTETWMWCSKLGEKDITTGTLIDIQPSQGSMFKSQNNKTWTAEQTEDLKYNLYIAKFKTKASTLVLKNKTLDSQDILVFNPFETESGSTQVRVACPAHGVAAGDKTSFDVGNASWIKINATSGKPNIGQTLTTVSGTGVIKNLRVTSVANQYEVKLDDIIGHFTATEAFTLNSIPMQMPPTQHFVKSYLGYEVSSETISSGAGTIATTFNPTFNGIPIGELNDENTVTAVDSADSFIVEVTTPATATGWVGGYVKLKAGKRYESFALNGEVAAHGCDEKWTINGIGHTINGLFSSSNYARMGEKIITPNERYWVEQPLKIASALNETIKLGGSGKSVYIKGLFTAATDYVSPVINLDAFGMTTWSKVIDNHTETQMAVAPNASTKWKAETDPINGVSLFKYVSKTIVLENPASDLKILFDVFKPANADYDFYVKVRSPEDQTNMDEIAWKLIPNLDKDFTSSDLTNDFRAIEFTCGDQIDDFNGGEAFGAFKVKIVGKAKNPALYPMFRSLRGIAVT
jgi:hypothetical protein